MKADLAPEVPATEQTVLRLGARDVTELLNILNVTKSRIDPQSGFQHPMATSVPSRCGHNVTNSADAPQFWAHLGLNSVCKHDTTDSIQHQRGQNAKEITQTMFSPTGRCLKDPFLAFDGGRFPAFKSKIWAHKKLPPNLFLPLFGSRIYQTCTLNRGAWPTLFLFMHMSAYIEMKIGPIYQYIYIHI